MELRPLKLAGTYEVRLSPRGDERGYFMRAYDDATFRAAGLATEWLQENQARSTRQGIVRGMHFQRPPRAETKLVRAIQGAVYDAFIDLRTGSPSYGQWDAVELTAEAHNAVYIPRGFAHGYCTLTDVSVVLYKVDSVYAPELEGGIRWNDPTVAIRWPVSDPMISDKDQKAMAFADFVSPF